MNRSVSIAVAMAVPASVWHMPHAAENTIFAYPAAVGETGGSAGQLKQEHRTMISGQRFRG